ncbi:MAG: mitochondrial fission ELM1 family protein [Hyphomicrobiaceae bacterium]|nr:mitochondrial fission ELM1 family protein [Hyphomicrobiaceae bacterium]
MQPQALTALLLADGKPGHYHQSEGVIAAIRRRRPVTSHRLEVRRRFFLPTRTLLQLVNRGVAPAVILRLGYGIDAANLPKAEVVVSAGGDTLAANAAAAKLLSAANIFCGRLRRLAPEHVRLVIVSLERFADRPNHLVSLPPSSIDLSVAAPRNGAAARFGRSQPPARVGVLIGGNSGAYRYRSEDWLQLTAFLREAHRLYGVHWLATTSRRSGHFIADALAAMAQTGEGGLERFIDFRRAGAGTLPSIFAAAHAILCTDDSTTMISEAIAARLPVVSVAPARSALEPREAEFREVLRHEGWYRSLPLSQLTPDTFLAALEEISPRTGNQLDELATAMSRRLPELFALP